MKKTIIFMMLILLIPISAAEKNHMKLLAVKEASTGYEGSTADLYLELIEGSGRVFLDTFPLTKLDTQMSTRFAKEIACSYLDVSCDNYDFIYTIKADSAIIGGPSAGAAITALTISSLMDIDIDKKATITGTINSGGAIGPVGGIKDKIKAASRSNLDTVIIPAGERFVEDNEKEEILIKPLLDIYNWTENINKTANKTLDLKEYGAALGVEVIESPDINKAFGVLAGRPIKEEVEGEIKKSDNYEQTMKGLAVDLCERSSALKSQIGSLDNETMQEQLEQALNLTEKGEISFEEQDFYSAASFCFGANVQLSDLLFTIEELSYGQIGNEKDKIKDGIRRLDKEITAREKKTISDLESFMIVKERLIDAQDYLKNIDPDSSDISNFQDLAYARERLHSAYSWYEFFNHEGKEFELNQDVLQKACSEKLAEADERYQYIRSIALTDLENTKSELDYAYQDMRNDDFELCIFKASKAKAEINMILSSIGVKQAKIDRVIEQKLKIIKDMIIKEQKKRVFPILGYSYYQYSSTLFEKKDYSSALLYSEYALELSNLDMYFKEKKNLPFYRFDLSYIYIFALGAVSGIIVGIRLRPKKKKTRARK